jgi:hypothetical protein
MEFYNIYSLRNEVPAVKDKLGRIRTFSVYNEFHRPVLSKALYETGFRPIYPENKKMCVVLSHDVDYIYDSKSNVEFAKIIIKRLVQLKFKEVIDEFKSSVLKRPNPKWLLDRFIDFEFAHNIKSTYFFLALSKEDKDYNYNINFLSKQIKKISKNKSEIAFHGGLDAYQNEQHFLKELEKLKKMVPDIQIKGYRSHFLMYDHIKTHDLIEKFGLEYDATLGLPDNLGFRNGMCYPFRPTNLSTGEFRDILEIPLNVMDVSFFKYMNLNVEDSFALFVNIYKEVKVINGVVSILWHNNNFDSDYEKLYYKIMNYVIEDQDSWITTHADLAVHWRKNNLSDLEAHLERKINHDRI